MARGVSGKGAGEVVGVEQGCWGRELEKGAGDAVGKGVGEGCLGVRGAGCEGQDTKHKESKAHARDTIANASHLLPQILKLVATVVPMPRPEGEALANRVL